MLHINKGSTPEIKATASRRPSATSLPLTQRSTVCRQPGRDCLVEMCAWLCARVHQSPHTQISNIRYDDSTSIHVVIQHAGGQTPRARIFVRPPNRWRAYACRQGGHFVRERVHLNQDVPIRYDRHSLIWGFRKGPTKRLNNMKLHNDTTQKIFVIIRQGK